MRGRVHIPTTTVVVVDDDGSEVAVAGMAGRAADLTLVDDLVRLQLMARRRGCAVRLRDATDELLALLELVGLADALPLEARREPELGEQARVEEVVQARDPPS